MRDFFGFLRTDIKAGVFIVFASAIIIFDDIGRVQQMNALPHYVWQIGAFLIFICSVISILYHQHKRIESFKPIPPSDPDAATAALSNAIAQLTYLRDARTDFEKRVSDAELHWGAILVGVLEVKPDTKPVPAPLWKTAYVKWVTEIKAIQKGALEAMDFKRDFLESINFQRNPGIKVLNEDNLGTEADKYELRRAYDERKSAIASIAAYRLLLVTRERQRKIAIASVAKAVVTTT
jgi:hypothetical protein